MTVLDQPATGHAPARDLPPPTRWWLALTVPISVMATAASVAGILVDRVYAHETPSWEAEAVGQDIANLVVFPVMLLCAYAVRRGRDRALPVLLGTVVYAAYTYAIYVFAVHFGPLFLVYVAVFGMSVWALVGGLSSVDASGFLGKVPRRLARFAGTFLVVIGVAFALLWLSADLPAMFSGVPSAELKDSGLPTNPVHVLDLSLFLPGAIAAGVLLRRGRDWGRLLAPMVLVAMAAISTGIVSLTVVHLARDQGGSLAVAAVIGLLGVVQAVTAWSLTIRLEGPPGDGPPSRGSPPTRRRRPSAR